MDSLDQSLTVTTSRDPDGTPVIADALADQWGVDSGPHATTVWFTLSLPPTEHPPELG